MKYHVGNIINYMIEYDSGIPKSVIVGIFLIVSVIIVVFYHYSTDVYKLLKKASWCLLGGYVFLVLCSTVLFREESESMRFVIKPLWSYSVLDNKLIAQLILNVAMFIPIGYFLGIALKKDNTIKILGIGCLLSFTIEIIQLLSKRGVFNVDDIIHNTLGCAIGYGIFRLGSFVMTACIR